MSGITIPATNAELRVAVESLAAQVERLTAERDAAVADARHLDGKSRDDRETIDRLLERAERAEADQKKSQQWLDEIELGLYSTQAFKESRERAEKAEQERDSWKEAKLAADKRIVRAEETRDAILVTSEREQANALNVARLSNKWAEQQQQVAYEAERARDAAIRERDKAFAERDEAEAGHKAANAYLNVFREEQYALRRESDELAQRLRDSRNAGRRLAVKLYDLAGGFTSPAFSELSAEEASLLYEWRKTQTHG